MNRDIWGSFSLVRSNSNQFISSPEFNLKHAANFWMDSWTPEPQYLWLSISEDLVLWLGSVEWRITDQFELYEGRLYVRLNSPRVANIMIIFNHSLCQSKYAFNLQYTMNNLHKYVRKWIGASVIPFSKTQYPKLYSAKEINDGNRCLAECRSNPCEESKLFYGITMTLFALQDKGVGHYSFSTWWRGL